MKLGVTMRSWLRFMGERVSVESVRAQADTTEDDQGLLRSLGPVSLTMFGVGNAIGAGIFVLTGVAAAQYAGPGITLSYLFAGITCFLTSLCYAEISTMIPSAGASFTYARVTLGRFPAWLIGWCMVIEYLIAGATVATGWSGYSQNLLGQFGISLPRVISGPPLDMVGGSLIASHRIVNAPAVLMVIACTSLLVRGLRHSATANSLMVAIKILVILAVVAVGSFYIHPANWAPFVPAVNRTGQFGWGGIFTGSAVAFFSYTGFEAMSTAARECRNPSRDLPIALFAALGICVLLYVSVSLVLTGIAPYSKLDTASPLSTALKLASPGLRWLIAVVNVGTVLGLGAAVLVSLFGQARTFYSMAVVGFLPKSFARVHSTYRTPSVAIICTGVGAAIVAGVLPIMLLGELVSMGILIAFSSVSLGVILLRRSRPNLPRPFRVPFHPWVPGAGLVSCIGLMFSLPRITWINIGIWLGVGIVLFFVIATTRPGKDAGHPAANCPAGSNQCNSFESTNLLHTDQFEDHGI